jgi:hypothetical protein
VLFMWMLLDIFEREADLAADKAEKFTHEMEIKNEND